MGESMTCGCGNIGRSSLMGGCGGFPDAPWHEVKEGLCEIQVRAGSFVAGIARLIDKHRLNNRLQLIGEIAWRDINNTCIVAVWNVWAPGSEGH